MNSEIKWRSTDGETTRDAVGRIEYQLGVKFPEDYIQCALKNHGGIPNYHVLDVKGHQETDFNRLLSLDPDEGEYLLSVYNRIRDRLVDHVYPFAGDSFGNSICFDYRHNKATPSIAFWDHEEAFLNKEKGVFYICDSFTELLSKLRPYQD